MKYLAKDAIEKIIVAMPENAISPCDYVDEETGEIYLEIGLAARTSCLHPMNYFDWWLAHWQDMLATEVEFLNDTLGDLADEDGSDLEHIALLERDADKSRMEISELKLKILDQQQKFGR